MSDWSRSSTETNYRYVGYIRTNSFQKAIGMFDPKRITRLKTYRSKKRETIEKEQHRNFAFREITTIEKFIIDWDKKQHAYTCPDCPINIINKMITDYDLDDVVLEELEYEFTDPKVTTWLNSLIEDGNTGKRRKKKDIITLPSTTKLYVTFKNKTTRDAEALKYLRQLNKDVTDYGFKFGVLDIVKLETERVKKYGEREKLPIHDLVDVSRWIFWNLRKDGWPPSDRLVTENGIERTANPAVVRQYKMSQKKGWTLQKEFQVWR